MKDEKCSMISTFYSQEGVVVSTDIENNRDNINIKQISKTYIWLSSSITLDISGVHCIPGTLVKYYSILLMCFLFEKLWLFNNCSF